MSLFSKFTRLWNTVRFLKPVQFYYRFKYSVWKTNSIPVYDLQHVSANNLKFKPFPGLPVLYKNSTFKFLNIEKEFSEIDWEYPDYGRLWTYNLNYFEFLNQEGMNREEGVRLIKDFEKSSRHNHTAWEPYPLSLRIINWVRFFISNKIDNRDFNTSLFSQVTALSGKLEYHLLANHLLENGFALLFGAYYFNNDFFYRKACHILIPQLREQVLSDGAHFELSPMYHCIMLGRVLDCYNLVSQNALFNQELESFLKEKAGMMLGWLEKIVFKNGDIPLMNDAAFGIALTYRQLKDYAGCLDIYPDIDIQLKESGYRKFMTEKMELLADVGSIGPDYQPGHAHADTFNFVLYLNERPIIVDTGTSTYEVNEVRFYERSTAAHNTVVVAGKNSSEVWGGHRVARRAQVKITKDSPDWIIANHSGYDYLGDHHSRSFKRLNDSFIIEDCTNGEACAYLHFAPEEEIELVGNGIKGKDFRIVFEGAQNITTDKKWLASEFNKRIQNNVVCIQFDQKLLTCIQAL